MNLSGVRWVAVFAATICAGIPAPSTDSPPPRPRLAVLVVFDQLRGDYPERWKDLFGDGGFRRLQREGAWFTNCHYPYATTMTAAGHASIVSGCMPNRHGIMINEWYDRREAAEVYCVTSDRYSIVPVLPGPASKKGAGCPDRMLVPTFGDTLKETTGGKGKVVALSLKDRSACLPGGRRPDLCCWLDNRTGAFCTSTYYRDRLPEWVTEFNSKKPADRWFGAEWTRLRPDIDYTKYSGPDDQPGEATGITRRQGRVFPHPMSAELTAPNKDYYDTVYCSPFGNELLLDLAKQAIVAENLGRRDVPDFLSVSFSTNDAIGHQWGPDSHEVMDVTLRSDLVVKELLEFLDAKVGRGNYVLAVTGDHGVCPLPEVSISRGHEAIRIRPADTAKDAEAFLNGTFGFRESEKGFWIEHINYPWVYLNHRKIESRGLDQAKVAEQLAKWLGERTGIKAVYTRDQLEAPENGHAILRAMKKSYHPHRSGDIALVTRPYTLFTVYEGGTSHGTPHEYDNHVPLFVLGPGVPAGRCSDTVSPLAIPAIFAHFLEVPKPAAAEVPLPDRISGR